MATRKPLNTERGPNLARVDVGRSSDIVSGAIPPAKYTLHPFHFHLHSSTHYL
jgi:hypothetical protein